MASGRAESGCAAQNIKVRSAHWNMRMDRRVFTGVEIVRARVARVKITLC